MKRYTHKIHWVLILMNIYVVSLFCFPGGITGRTQKSGTNGCGSCHSFNSNFVVTISGPTTLAAGATGSYNVTMTGTRTGVDIAASSGTLTPGANLQKISDELTHTAPTNPGLFPFTYTAPLTTGTATIYATGANTINNWNFAANFAVLITTATSVSTQTFGNMPSQIQMMQNYPNPFNPSTTITFSLPVSDKATVTIFDLTGKKIATLVNELVPAGTTSVRFDGTHMSSGIYFYQLLVGSFSQVKRMVLLK